MTVSLHTLAFVFACTAGAVACSSDVEPVSPSSSSGSAEEAEGSSGFEPDPGATSSGAATQGDCALEIPLRGAIEATLEARQCVTQGFTTTVDGLSVRLLRAGAPLPAVGEAVVVGVRIQDDRVETRQVYQTPEGACSFVVDRIGASTKLTTVAQGHGTCTKPALRQPAQGERTVDGGAADEVEVGAFTFATTFFVE